jgi:hypothetical protein
MSLTSLEVHLLKLGYERFWHGCFSVHATFVCRPEAWVCESFLQPDCAWIQGGMLYMLVEQQPPESCDDWP